LKFLTLICYATMAFQAQTLFSTAQKWDITWTWTGWMASSAVDLYTTVLNTDWPEWMAPRFFRVPSSKSLTSTSIMQRTLLSESIPIRRSSAILSFDAVQFCSKYRSKYRVFQKELYNSIPNVTIWRVLRKGSHLKAYKLSISERLEWHIVCTPLGVNLFLTLSTFQHLECHCKSLSEHNEP
jgi:hypothetical protein